MALTVLAAGARLGRRLSCPGPGRGHWTAAGRSRSRREAAEAEAAAPVVQYVGERAARADRIFVWGFSFSGALGVPTFVLPGSGPTPRAGSRPRRRIQPVPYRLELDQKVRTARLPLRSSLRRSFLAPRPLREAVTLWGSDSGRTPLERLQEPKGKAVGAQPTMMERLVHLHVTRGSGLSPQLR